MRYTTKEFTIDSNEKRIYVYGNVTFIHLYKTALKCFTEHTPFSAVPFPTKLFGEVDMFTSPKVGGVLNW